jgi:aarF domain-containing kinase
MPQSQLLRVLREELGADWRSRMKEFDNVPIAAASIGQVHRVVSLDGRAGAMKVQYPGVARSIKSDISNLKRLVQLMDFLPRGLFIDESMKAAEEELTLECDYEHEARSQMRYKRLIGDEPGVHVPAVISELSTKRIITTEMVQGLPLDRLDAPELSQAVRNSVAARLLRICLRELFEFRFMQTDPNWSNFLYNPATDTIHLIDFGASREFSKSFVTQYLKMVHACAQRDRQTVIDTGVAMGFLTGDESQSMLDAHVEAAFIVGEPFASADAYDFHTGRIAERVGKLAAVMVKGRLTPPPRDSYTLHRKLSGAFLSCSKLKARIPCRDVFMEFYDKSVAGGVAP